MNEAIIPIAMFASTFAILYVFFTTRHKERLALIEKGADASLFNTGKKGETKGRSTVTLKLGMLSVGIALGILLGSIIHENEWLPEEVGYFSMIFLCGGISLVLFYFIDRKIAKENN
ncbi:MAG: DUF6249 domain-containing protein [Bacteroidota bacterium]